MNCPATNSAAICGEEDRGYILSYLNQGYAWVSSKAIWRGIALSLRRSFNADGRRTFRKKLVNKSGLDDCHFTAHELGQGLHWGWLCARVRDQENPDRWN